ncbi:MAG: nucleoside deaminase [Phycisphaerales bacterium]|nr:MAG: nucleoside deaminase [Phycisphaerales bacterium]
MRFSEATLRLPDWTETFLANEEQLYPTAHERMRLAVRLAQLNIEHQSGGPFGAAIFELTTGRLVAVGVNRVESTHCSIAHAEMLAIAIAQQTVGRYDLGSQQDLVYELVTSTEPCAMCLGAIPWSGVRSLVCGARDEDARRIGFDEGTKPGNWVQSLENRGISVLRDVLRKEAEAVLVEYLKRGGLIYNARRKESPELGR